MIKCNDGHNLNSIEAIKTMKISSVTQKIEALNRITEVVLRELGAIKPKNRALS